MKKIILLLTTALLFASCLPAKLPPQNLAPSPVYKTENINFGGSEWIHIQVVWKKGEADPFMKNTPVILTVDYPDGRQGKIWTEFDGNAELFIPNLSDECKKSKISIEIDKEEQEKRFKIAEAKAEEQKERIAKGEKRAEILTPDPAKWIFADEKAEITVRFGCGYPEADEMLIYLDFKKSKHKFYRWKGKYAVSDDRLELFVTDYAEGYEDGVGGYGSLTDYAELRFSADGGTLTIETPLSDVLPFADDLYKKYRFPVPLVLTRTEGKSQ